MLAAIQFNGELQILTCEVEVKPVHRMLATELTARDLAIAKVVPEFLFSLGAMYPKTARTINLVGRCIVLLHALTRLASLADLSRWERFSSHPSPLLMGEVFIAPVLAQ